MNIVAPHAKVKSHAVKFFPTAAVDGKNFDKHKRPLRRLPASLQALSGIARSSELFKSALAKTQLVSRCGFDPGAAAEYDAFALGKLEERPDAKVWKIEASERWDLEDVLAAEPGTAQHIGLNPADGAFVRFTSVDIDECFLSTAEALDLCEQHGIPLPICIIRDRYTGHVHLVWLFAWDHKSPRARARVKYIRRAITNLVGGDASFSGTLTKNPFARNVGGAPIYDVAWTPGYEPLELDAFDDVLAAARAFAAASPERGAGSYEKDSARRNCGLFKRARKWAYAEARAGTYCNQALLGFLHEQNHFARKGPLPRSEIRSIARSIDRFIVLKYIPRLLRGRRRKNRGVLAERVKGMSLRERQQIGQKYVAEKKHAASVEKIRAARAAEPEATQAQIAKAAGVSLSTVKRRWKEASPQGVIRCSIRNGARDAGEQSPKGDARGQGPARDDAESDAARSDAPGLAKSDSNKSGKKPGNIELAIETQNESLEARGEEFTQNGIPKRLLKEFGRGRNGSYRVLDTLRAFGLYSASSTSGLYAPAVKALVAEREAAKMREAWKSEKPKFVGRLAEFRVTYFDQACDRKYRKFRIEDNEDDEDDFGGLFTTDCLRDVELWTCGRWIYVRHVGGAFATFASGKPVRFARRTDGLLLPGHVSARFVRTQRPPEFGFMPPVPRRRKHESTDEYIRRAYPRGLFPDLALAAAA